MYDPKQYHTRQLVVTQPRPTAIVCRSSRATDTYRFINSIAPRVCQITVLLMACFVMQLNRKMNLQVTTMHHRTANHMLYGTETVALNVT